MTNPADQLRFSRSARDLLVIAQQHPELTSVARKARPALAAIDQGREALEESLDRERRELMRVNEARLQRYEDAAEPWARSWTTVQREVEQLDLLAAHERLRERAAAVLPFQVEGSQP